MPTIQAADLTPFIDSILRAAGAPASYADIVARHLVDANLTGHDSHGVIRMTEYMRAIDEGRMDPAAAPKITDETAIHGADRRRLNIRPSDGGHGQRNRHRQGARKRTGAGSNVQHRPHRSPGRLRGDGGGCRPGGHDLGWRHRRAALDRDSAQGQRPQARRQPHRHGFSQRETRSRHSRFRHLDVGGGQGAGGGIERARRCRRNGSSMRRDGPPPMRPS